MKHRTILLLLILAICTPEYLFSQCIVDAGPSFHLCLSSGETRQIMAEIKQGVPPYKVNWLHASNSPFNINYHMDDTTILNPIISGVRYNEPFNPITVRVIDANEDTCYSTINVTGSFFIDLLDATPIWVRTGQLDTICGPRSITGGFLPYKNFIWKEELLFDDADTTQCTIINHPLDKSNTYYHGFSTYVRNANYTATDYKGCPFGENVYIGFYLTGLEETSMAASPVLFPNPSNGKINIPSGLDIRSYELLDTQGKAIGEMHLVEKDQQTIDLNIDKGIYFIRLKDADKRLYVLKCIIQ